MPVSEGPEQASPRQTGVACADAVLAIEGYTYAALARRTDSRYAPQAIHLLESALVASGTDRPRSRTFLFANLAGTHLANNEINAAGHAGKQALDAADKITSGRVDREFRVLKHDAEQHMHPTARHLADQINDRLLRHAS